MSIEAVDLFTKLIRLGEDGTAQPLERDRRALSRASSWTLATYHAEDNAAVHADHWEMHPHADEVVGVLAGKLRVYLRGEGEAGGAPVALGAGQAALVPAGTWHRLEVEGPVDLFSLTQPAGSRLEPVG